MLLERGNTTIINYRGAIFKIIAKVEIKMKPQYQ